MRRFLDPKVIAKLKDTKIRVKTAVEGIRPGLHRSHYQGMSVEFSQHREYMAGDEPKYVDWKVYARTDKYYVKTFQAETNMRCYIILDTSASMGYGSNGITKLEYGCFLAASLSYLMLNQGDSVGLFLVADELKGYLPPRPSLSYMDPITRALEGARPSGRTDLGRCFALIAEKVKRRGFMVVISDLMDDMEKCIRGLKYFKHRKNEVMVLQLLDPEEISMDLGGPHLFVDMESGQEIAADPSTSREKYERNAQGFISECRRKCREGFINHILVRTDLPLEEIIPYLKRFGR